MSTTLLVVDDNPADRALCKMHLRSLQGLEVITAETLEEARSKMAGAQLMLLDHNLPDGEGVELLAELQAAEVDLPIILLTGGGDENLAVRAMRLGAYDYLPKDGLDATRLVRSVEGALEERRLRTELSWRLRELEARNRELQTYSTAVAHDLRAPLQAMLASIELTVLLHGQEMPPGATQRISQLLTSIGRMTSMLDSLLEYAQAGTRDPSPAEFIDTTETVRAIVTDLQPLAEKRGGRITLAALPELLAQPNQVTQVFQNLVDNSLKHGANNVWIGAQRDPDGWRLSVRDDGPGIPLEDQRRVFELLQRGSRASTNPGIGLGLAITRKLVEHWGGSVQLDSAPGAGTTFHLLMPTGVAR